MQRHEQRTASGTRRLNRRRLIGGVTGLGLASAFLAACGGDGDDEGGSSGASVPANAPQVSQSQNTTEQAQPGGIYQGFTTTDITNFDPIAATGNVDRGVAAWATSRLFRFQPGVNEPSKGEVVGDLVESYEINLDALQVTMKLRPNAKWDPRAPTNSRPLDSQDVKFSWDKFKAQSVYRRDWVSELNPAAPFVDVQTPDARTAVLKLNYPLGAVFDYLGNTLGMFIMPRESEGGYDPRRELRGTGPWLLDKYTPSVGFEWKKNPNYYVENRPWLDGWSNPIVSEYAQQLAQFRAGNIWGNVVRTDDVIQTYKDLPQLKLMQDEWGPNAPGIFFGWSGSPFLDVRVRQAMSMLIDRETIGAQYSDADRYKANGITLDLVHDNFIGRGWGEYWLDPFGSDMGENGKYFKRDVAEAKKLLSAAGHQNGFKTTFYGPTGTPYGVNYQRDAEALAGMLREGGIEVSFKQVDYSSDYVPNYNYNQAFDGISVFVNTTYGGVANNLRTNWHSASTQDRSPYAPAKINKPGGEKDTRLDGLIDGLLRETNRANAVKQAHEIQRYMAGVMYTIPYSYKVRTPTLTWPWVGNAGVYRAWAVNSAPNDVYPQLWFDKAKKPS